MIAEAPTVIAAIDFAKGETHFTMDAGGSAVAQPDFATAEMIFAKAEPICRNWHNRLDLKLLAGGFGGFSRKGLTGQAFWRAALTRSGVMGSWNSRAPVAS